MKLAGKHRFAGSRHGLFAGFAVAVSLLFSTSSVAESPSASGLGRDDEVSGVMSIVSADEDYAMSLNGTSQYATAPDNSGFDITGAITVEARV